MCVRIYSIDKHRVHKVKTNSDSFCFSQLVFFRDEILQQRNRFNLCIVQQVSASRKFILEGPGCAVGESTAGSDILTISGRLQNLPVSHL